MGKALSVVLSEKERDLLTRNVKSRSVSLRLIKQKN